MLKKGALLNKEEPSNQTKKPFQKPFRMTEPSKFTWVKPEKTFDKYAPTKVKVHQDFFGTYPHLKTHKLNVFFDQYNEFVRLVFKNKKPTDEKMNITYVLGLGKALGLKVAKDTFSDQNLKSREAIQQLKEKLITRFYRMVLQENKEIFPTPPQGKSAHKKTSLLSLEKHNSVSSDIRPDNRKRSESQERKGEGNVENTPQPKAPVKMNADDTTEHKVAKNEVQPLYKYMVGKGNNALLVRSLFKNRFWWMIADKGADMERVNFMWTQVKNASYMDALLCKFPEKQSGLGGKSGKAPSKEPPAYAADSIYAKQLENKIYNKCEDNFHVANKKALFLNMRNYYDSLSQEPFVNIPLTFHVKNGTADPDFHKFKEYYRQREAQVRERKALRIKLKQERNVMLA